VDEDQLLALAQEVHETLRRRRLTLSTAESCTGGLVGHVLTEVPGSSEWYVGGIVSYSDRMKQGQLGVPDETLEHHGAVSAQTCVAMADGARTRYETSIALAVTGIAGPDGGSDAKPVGLTYVGFADESGHDVRRHQWHGDRHANKMASAGASLQLLLEHLGGE
jgi:PncC family amidohydrolase